MKMITLVATFLLSANALALDCHGTEPFWNATISDQEVYLSGSGYEPGITYAVSEVNGPEGMQESFAQVYYGELGRYQPLAVVTSTKCSDGMSDFEFPQEIFLFTGTETLYGCCGEGIDMDSSELKQGMRVDIEL